MRTEIPRASNIFNNIQHEDFNKIQIWSKTNKIKVNSTKSKMIVFTKKRSDIPVVYKYGNNGESTDNC